jgi:hypothetical protein
MNTDKKNKNKHFQADENRGQTDASARQSAPWDTLVSPL